MSSHLARYNIQFLIIQSHSITPSIFFHQTSGKYPTQYKIEGLTQQSIFPLLQNPSILDPSNHFNIPHPSLIPFLNLPWKIELSYLTSSDPNPCSSLFLNSPYIIILSRRGFSSESLIKIPQPNALSDFHYPI